MESNKFQSPSTEEMVSGKSKLACPLCITPLNVRKSVKGKPYVVCDPCGMQMFIRKEKGIKALEKGLAKGFSSSSPAAKTLHEKIHSLEKQLSETERRYENARSAHGQLANRNRLVNEKDIELTELRKRIRRFEKVIFRTCPECGESFQIAENLIRTSWVDGRFQGFQCPISGCRGIVPPRLEEN